MSPSTPKEARGAPPAPEVPKSLANLRSALARVPWILFLLAGVLLPSAVWICRDRTAWPWDQAWYGEVSVDLWFDLSHSLWDWCRTMLTGMNMKPPGIVWLGQLFVPFGAWCGSIENALLFSVLLTQAATLLVIYRIGRAIAPESQAVPALGVCLAAAAQSFVGLSHEFFVEPLQAFTVAWILLIAVRCTEWPAPRTAIHFAAALLAGILAKATTPLYCLFPCLYIGLILIRRRFWQGWNSEWRLPSSRALAVATAATMPLTAMWYAVNLKAVWQHVREASSGEIALHYGSHASVASKLFVWLRLLDQSFLSPYLGWAVILAAAGGVAARLSAGRKHALPAAIRLTAVLSALQCGLLLLTFSSNDAVDPRYMYPILALLLLIVISLVRAVTSRWLLAIVFAVCGLQFVHVQRAALDTGVAAANPFNWPMKPFQNPSRYRDVERVVRMTSTVTGRYNIVGVEEPWLSANTLSFFAAKHRLDSGVRSYFTSLGYEQNDISAAVKRVEDFDPMYNITLAESCQSKPPNFVNLVSLPMLRHVQADPHFALVSGPSANGILVFRRNGQEAR